MVERPESFKHKDFSEPIELARREGGLFTRTIYAEGHGDALVKGGTGPKEGEYVKRSYGKCSISQGSGEGRKKAPKKTFYIKQPGVGRRTNGRFLKSDSERIRG